MSQANNRFGQVGGAGAAVGNGKRLPPLETKGPSEQKEKGPAEPKKKSKTEKIKEDLAKIEEAVEERDKAKSPENTMGNQKRTSKEPNSPKKTKPAKPPKPAGLGKGVEGDLSLQATSYSFGKKKHFVTNTQKQREIDKLTLDKENANKKLQKSRVLSPLADVKVPKVDKTEAQNHNDDKKPGSLTINLFLSDDAITRAAGAPDSDKRSPSTGGRQLSVQVPLDQLDLLQSLPNGKAKLLPKVGESENEPIDLNKTYPPPQPRPGTPPQKFAQDFSKSVGNGCYSGEPNRTLYRNPADSYQGTVWLMGQAPKTPGRLELPPITAGQAGKFETYVPPSSSYNFSQKNEDEHGDGDHRIRELNEGIERKKKKRKKHRHHQHHSDNHHKDGGQSLQQPGDEKVMQWLEGHEFDVMPSELDPEMEGRMSVNAYDRPSSIMAARPSNLPGAYGHGGAALSGTDLPDMFTIEQIAALKEMQSGMTGVDRYVATPRAWNQDGDDFASGTYTKTPQLDPGLHKQDMPQPYGPGPPSDILRESSSQYVILENRNKTHNSTPRTSRTLQTEQTSYSDPVRKSEMGTQAGGPIREETFYVQGTPHRSVACSTDEDKQNTQRALGGVHSVGIGPEQLTKEDSNPQKESGYSTIRSDGGSNQNKQVSTQNRDNQSQISNTSPSDRNVAIELRPKNVQILKVLRENEELGNSHSVNRRTAHYSSRQGNQEEPSHRRNSSHDDMSHDDSGCPADELDNVLGDEETYTVFLKTKDGAIIGPFQLDIENVEVGLPTAGDLLEEGSSSEAKAKADNSGWLLKNASKLWM